MDSAAPARERLVKPVFDYPFATAPEPGQTLEVAPGVQWIRMPMPGPLSHINIWSVVDDGGFAQFDTGLRTDETAAAWRTLFAAAPAGARMTRVLITHMHPDHVGMAGWLTRKFNCRMWMTRQEYLYCRVLMSDTGREAPEVAVDFFRRAGWGEPALEDYRARFGNFGKRIHALPDSFNRVVDGQRIPIGEHEWRVVVGTGHSPEHACYHCPDLKVFISGDQVLPRISSNVSVYPTEPDADPMSDWLDSLAKIKAAVPDDVLVLPSHNEPFRGLHARLDYLAASQQRALDRLLQRLSERKRAVDVFATLFAREISVSDTMLLNLATGEAVACLNHLVQRGLARCELDAQGVLWYQQA